MYILILTATIPQASKATGLLQSIMARREYTCCAPEKNSLDSRMQELDIYEVEVILQMRILE